METKTRFSFGVFSYAKKYRRLAFLSVILVLVELSVELFHPYLLAKIIDDGILQGDLTIIVRWGSVMVGLSLAAFIAGILNSFFATHVGQSTGYEVRSKLFQRIQYASFDQLKQFATSSLIMRLTNDITQIQNSIVMTLRYLLRPPLVITGSLIMAFIVNPKLALVLLITIPILTVIVGYVFKKGANHFKEAQGKLDKLNGIMRENLVGFKLIKAFVRRKKEADRFLTANSTLRNKMIYTLRLMEVTQPTLLFVMNMAILVILWLGREWLQGGELPVGDVVAVLNYVLRITGALSSIPMLIMTYSRANASSERIMDVLLHSETDHSESNRKATLEGDIRFEDVSFSYGEDAAAPALQHVSFSAKPKQMTAILGATGSGKSTIFQLIPRLYKPTTGEIYVDGQEIRTFSLSSLRNQMSYVSQETLLFSGTVKENICWGNSDASDEELIEAAQHAQIHDTIMKLPKQYDALISQKGNNLSGGQKQRIAIARALIRKPAILLLDDSTSALDTETEAKLMQSLHYYSCTTLIITQKISTAMNADQILLLDQGEILEQGHHKELVERSSLYRELVRSQNSVE